MASFLPGPAGKLLELQQCGKSHEATPALLGLTDDFARPQLLQNGQAILDADFARPAWRAALESAYEVAQWDPHHPLLQHHNVRACMLSPASCRAARLLVLVAALKLAPAGEAAFARVKDPTGAIGAAIHRGVLEAEPSLGPGCVLLLQNVPVLSAQPRLHYLCVTADNVLAVFPPDAQPPPQCAPGLLPQPPPRAAPLQQTQQRAATTCTQAVVQPPTQAWLEPNADASCGAPPPTQAFTPAQPWHGGSAVGHPPSAAKAHAPAAGAPPGQLPPALQQQQQHTACHQPSVPLPARHHAPTTAGAAPPSSQDAQQQAWQTHMAVPPAPAPATTGAGGLGRQQQQWSALLGLPAAVPSQQASAAPETASHSAGFEQSHKRQRTAEEEPPPATLQQQAPQPLQPPQPLQAACSATTCATAQGPAPPWQPGAHGPAAAAATWGKACPPAGNVLGIIGAPPPLPQPAAAAAAIGKRSIIDELLADAADEEAFDDCML